MKNFLIFLFCFICCLWNFNLVLAAGDKEGNPPGGTCPVLDPDCQGIYCDASYCTGNKEGATCVSKQICEFNLSGYAQDSEQCKFADGWKTTFNGGRRCVFSDKSCQRYKDSKQYGLCDEHSDCVSCPKDKPYYPSTKCDYTSKQCKTVYECGKNECTDFNSCCGKKTDANGKKMTYPYYGCTNVITKDKYGQRDSTALCKRIDGCGVSNCNPLLEDQLHECNNFYGCNTATGQCFLDKTSKNVLWKCEQTCFKSTTTTTRQKATTTTTTKAGEVTPLPTPIKPAPGKGTTTTSTKASPPNNFGCSAVSVWWMKYTNTGITKYPQDSYITSIKPEDGILDNPKLEFSAEDCKTCKFEIISTEGKDVTLNQFINDNKDVFTKNQEPVLKTSEDRYHFERSKIFDNSIILDVTHLYPGKYQINVSCLGPTQVEPSTDSVKFVLYPYIRWREVMPVINNE